MKILSGALFVLLCLSIAAKGSGGIDEIYEKPQSRKTWGEQFAEYVNYGGYSKSYALVIGISTYEGYKTLPTENDPIRVKNYLLHVAGFDYVHLLTEEKATISRIRDIMEDIFPRLIDKNDRFLFYWSGHGVTRPLPVGRKMGYLPLKLTAKEKYSEMIHMNNIKVWDNYLEAKQTLYLLDSCFSGLAVGKPLGSDIRQLTIKQMARPSRHLITAGTAGQETIAVDSIGGSVFTTALLDGLRGAADTTSAFESDGLVSVHELVDYIKKRVAFECENYGWTQSITPQPFDLRINEGEFFFITGDYKTDRLVSRGLHITEDFEYGDPVPMSGESSQPGKKDQNSVFKNVEILCPDQPLPNIDILNLIQRYSGKMSNEDIENLKLDYWKKRNLNNFQNSIYATEKFVIDCGTRLMWQKGGSNFKYMTREDAEKYVKRLNQQRFRGYYDWRLPTLAEYYSLYKFDDTYGLFVFPFEKKQKPFWVADRNNVPGEAWSVHLAKDIQGYVKSQSVKPSSQYYVRVVRSIR